MPLVNLPVGWSCFKTINTVIPGLMFARVVPFMLIVFSPFKLIQGSDGWMAQADQVETAGYDAADDENAGGAN